MELDISLSKQADSRATEGIENETPKVGLKTAVGEREREARGWGQRGAGDVSHRGSYSVFYSPRTSSARLRCLERVRQRQRQRVLF